MTPNTLTTLAPGIHRIIAPNPGMMTGPGTNTYLVGDSSIAVIDPGPLIEEHVDNIVAQSPGPIEWILVTHTHPDHSPAAMRLKQLTGAKVLGMTHGQDDGHQDLRFRSDQEISDLERLYSDEFSLLVLHTPGHASNHLCYLHEESGYLFTGDHIMNGSTVVINPPDGDMLDYLESLEKLKSFDITHLAPGHGDVIDRPFDAVDWIIEHRLEREEKIIGRLTENPGKTLSELVVFAYDEVDSRLHAWAERSLLAHLIKLEKENRAQRIEECWSILQ
ncbi:MAG: MBL fold metallo-hydrolase [Pseudomonadota bacterium]